jgi:hemerythrin-like domain-containing protein
MSEGVERSLRGDAEGVRVFLRQARSFIGMLRAHIAKEDDCLAGVVRRAFSDEDGERLAREFEEMERQEIGDRTFERFAAMVAALEAKYASAAGG